MVLDSAVRQVDAAGFALSRAKQMALRRGDDALVVASSDRDVDAIAAEWLSDEGFLRIERLCSGGMLAFRCKEGEGRVTVCAAHRLHELKIIGHERSFQHVMPMFVDSMRKDDVMALINMTSDGSCRFLVPAPHDFLTFGW